MFTSQEISKRIKTGILADVRSETVSISVKSYSELHDYSDANCYGDSEALLDDLEASGPNLYVTHADNLEAICNLMNPAMDIVDEWIKSGGIVANLPNSANDQSVIPTTSDLAANKANIAAIDALVRTEKYHHLVAWGKWLGFTPETVLKSVEEAECDNAPSDAIQKLNGEWSCLGDMSGFQIPQVSERIGLGVAC